MASDRLASEAGIGKVLVTGAGGFIGRALCNHLAVESGLGVIAVTRRGCAELKDGITQVHLDLRRDKLSADLLTGVSHVVHLAASEHIRDRKSQSEGEDNRMTERLLGAIDGSSVEHVVYMSSIGVLGAGGGSPDRPLEESQVSSPVGAYGKSKLSGEALVKQLPKPEAISWTIVRPPLVYGPGAMGSFRQLLKLVGSGVPLPLGSLTNGRTMISRTNLISLIERCLWHPGARFEVFHACDSDTLTVCELVRTVEYMMGRKRSRVVKCPRFLLRLLGVVSGRRMAVEQLMQPLWLSNQKALDLLGWRPPESVSSGLKETVSHDLLTAPQRYGQCD